MLGNRQDQGSTGNYIPQDTGFDGGSVSTPSTSIVLNGLTSRRTYYIRVLARNARGSGPYCKNTEQNCLIVSAANVVSVTVL